MKDVVDLFIVPLPFYLVALTFYIIGEQSELT